MFKLFQKILILAALLTAAPLSHSPQAGEGRDGGDYFGPYRAELVRVIDGDTFELDIFLWPGLTNRAKVRLTGVNTPEKRGRVSACEKKAGKKATAFATGFLNNGAPIKVLVKGKGKYGRLLVEITVNGQDLGEALITAGLARPYSGGKRQPWC